VTFTRALSSQVFKAFPALGYAAFRFEARRRWASDVEGSLALNQTFMDALGLSVDDAEQMTAKFIDASADVGFMNRRLMAMAPRELERFVARLPVECFSAADELMQSDRPLIFCGAHCGHYAMTALKLAHLASGVRESLTFYNPPELNPFSPTMTTLFERLNCGAGTALNNRAGILQAFRALQRGAALAIMPDFSVPGETSEFVPFFGSFYAVMPGAATFAIRSRARVMTAHVLPGPLGPTLKIVNIADLSQSPMATHEAFDLTCKIMRALETVIAANPEYWMFWPEFRNRTWGRVSVPTTYDAWHASIEENAGRFAERDPELADALRSIA